jgi:hypothetical protein
LAIPTIGRSCIHARGELPRIVRDGALRLNPPGIELAVAESFPPP